MGYRNVLELEGRGASRATASTLSGPDMRLTGVRKQPLAGGRACVAIRPEEFAARRDSGRRQHDRRAGRQRRVLRPRFAGRRASPPSGTLLHVRAAACAGAGRHRARARSGRARAGLSERAIRMSSDAPRRAGSPRAPLRPRAAAGRAGRGLHAAAVRLPVPLRARAVVQAEGRRRARELRALLHDRQPLADDLDDAAGSRCRPR